MSDESTDTGVPTGDVAPDGGEPGLLAGACPNGHLTYPTHPRCPTCGEHQTDTVDLADRTATVVTWTRSTATPPGVRQPNSLAIVAFEVDGETVRAIGQLAEGEDDVAIGDEVRPVYAERLRDPDAGIRAAESQRWDGYRFVSV